MLTASFVALGAGCVFPSTSFADTTNGDHSVLGGNQVDAPISAPIDISGNALAVFGTANASSHGGAKVVNKGGGGHDGNKTSGKGSVAGGNQVNAPISAPINACGNAIAIFGTADAGCKGGAKVINNGTGGGGSKTSGKHSVLGGNQVTAPISAPIDACGNAIAIFGSSEAGCKGGAKVVNEGGHNGNVTSGNSSVGGGNQVYAPVSTPVNVCGNSAAVFGEAVSGCKGGAKVVNEGGSGGLETSGDHSVLGGNQFDAPVSAPVNVCGNAAAGLGEATAGCEGGSETHNHGQMDPSGDGSVAGGNQVHAPVSFPVNACGNAAAVLGDAAAACDGGASSDSFIPGGMHTSGKHSVGGGNQVYAPITAPITVCGNAVAVAASTAAGCVGGSHAEGTGAPHGKTSGDSSVLGGNQPVAPVKAPAEACGTNAQCQGGEEGHDRKAGPADLGLPVLPMVPGLTKVIPVGGGVPALPQMRMHSPAPALPGLGSLPVGSVTKTLPMRTKSDPLAGLPVKGLPVNGLPTGGLPLRTGGNGLPLGDLTGSLPLGSLPALPAAPALPGARQVPAPGNLDELPVVGGNAPVLDSVPVGGHLKAPQTGGTVQELTDAVPASAEAPSQTGSMVVLILGGVLAAISATGAFFRKVVRK
jgi:hypothetical protein